MFDVDEKHLTYIHQYTTASQLTQAPESRKTFGWMLPHPCLPSFLLSISILLPLHMEGGNNFDCPLAHVVKIKKFDKLSS